MPTYSEPLWRDLKEKQDRFTEDFLNGTDTEAVFRARLYGLGFRGDSLSTEISLAKMVKHDRDIEAFKKKTGFDGEQGTYSDPKCSLCQRLVSEPTKSDLLRAMATEQGLPFIDIPLVRMEKPIPWAPRGWHDADK